MPCYNLFDRYDIVGTRPVWRDALVDLTSGQSVLVARQRNGMERDLVKMAGVTVLPVHDPTQAKFITALPPNYRIARGAASDER